MVKVRTTRAGHPARSRRSRRRKSRTLDHSFGDVPDGARGKQALGRRGKSATAGAGRSTNTAKARTRSRAASSVPDQASTPVAMARQDQNRVLREMVELLRHENQTLESQVRAAERRSLEADLYCRAAESALLAVRVLAKGVSSKTTEGKRLRATARQLLEEAGLHPPGTLGSSRNTRKRRRKHPVDKYSGSRLP